MRPANSLPTPRRGAANISEGASRRCRDARRRRRSRVGAPVSAKLTEFEEARSLVLERAQPLAPETVVLRDALRRVLAEADPRDVDVPPFANSAMDGFALRAGDSGAGVRLRVVDESRAGAPARGGGRAGRGLRDLDRRGDARGRRCRRGGRGHAPPGRARSSWPSRSSRPAMCATPATTCGPAQSLLAPGVRLGPNELGVLASVGARERPRRAPAAGRDPDDRRRAGRAWRRAAAARERCATPERYVIPALVRAGRRGRGGLGRARARRARADRARRSARRSRPTSS